MKNHNLTCDSLTEN